MTRTLPGRHQVLAETDIRAAATREATVEAGRTTELALAAEIDRVRRRRRVRR